MKLRYVCQLIEIQNLGLFVHLEIQMYVNLRVIFGSKHENMSLSRKCHQKIDLEFELGLSPLQSST